MSTTFADQAVIAIENTRLFEAEQQRSRELAELLEQQTPRRRCSKSSSSPGELQPVFEAMLENAVRLCQAKFGNMLPLRRRSVTHSLRLHGVPPAFAEARRRR